MVNTGLQRSNFVLILVVQFLKLRVFDHVLCHFVPHVSVAPLYVTRLCDFSVEIGYLLLQIVVQLCDLLFGLPLSCTIPLLLSLKAFQPLSLNELNIFGRP